MKTIWSGRVFRRDGDAEQPALAGGVDPVHRLHRGDLEPFGPDSGPTFRILAVSRSVTSAAPSGRKAIPHGTRSPVATTLATASWSSSPCGGRVGRGGEAGRFAGGVGLGGPKAHPAAAVARLTATNATGPAQAPVR